MINSNKTMTKLTPILLLKRHGVWGLRDYSDAEAVKKALVFCRRQGRLPVIYSVPNCAAKARMLSSVDAWPQAADLFYFGNADSTWRKIDG